MKINECLIGEIYEIINIEADIRIKKRLQDMGLTHGTKMKIMSYYSDNAYIINMRGSRIAIGKDIANMISVVKESYNRIEDNSHKHDRHQERNKHKRKCKCLFRKDT